VTKRVRKWLSWVVKLGVCAAALWYLSDKITLEDRVRLQADPSRTHRLLSESPETLRIELGDAVGSVQEVRRSELATEEQLRQLGGGKRSIERGLQSIARGIDWGWAGWALLAAGPSVFIMAWRLRILLATQSILLSARDAILLTFAGNFFNFSLPGTTGGDLYKAYHIARQTHKRTEGITIVLLDRVIGLISFLLIATGTILVLWLLGKPMIGAYGKWVGYFMLAFIVASCLFFSRRMRKWIRYEALLTRLPMADKLRRIDETALSVRFHTWPMAASLLGTFANHLMIVASIYLLARGLGIHPHGNLRQTDLFLACLLASSVGFLFAAVPISVQGFGLLEAVFYKVLVEGGWASPSQMLALTLSYRLVQVFWSLPGIIVPWLGFQRPSEESLAATVDSAAGPLGAG